MMKFLHLLVGCAVGGLNAHASVSLFGLWGWLWLIPTCIWVGVMTARTMPD